MINYALIHNYDYIWMMDDDGYPAFNSLEKLAKIYLQNMFVFQLLLMRFIQINWFLLCQYQYLIIINIK